MRRQVWLAMSITVLVLVAGSTIDGLLRRPARPAQAKAASPHGAHQSLKPMLARAELAILDARLRVKPALARAELTLLDARIRVTPAMARAELALLDARLRAMPALDRAALAIGSTAGRSREMARALPNPGPLPIAGATLLALVLVTLTAWRSRRRGARATALELARRGRSTAFIARRLGVEQDAVRSLMRPAAESEASGSIFRPAGSSRRERPGAWPRRAANLMRRA